MPISQVGQEQVGNGLFQIVKRGIDVSLPGYAERFRLMPNRIMRLRSDPKYREVSCTEDVFVCWR